MELAVRRALILALGTALSLAPLAYVTGSAVAQTKSPAGAYKTPRNAFGQPDLGGFWSNASLTPLTRPASAGGKAVYTEEEVKKLEAQVVAEVEEGNADTDPNAPAEAPRASTATVRPEFAAAGGDVGGYNRGWLDPGNHVMRVGGEARTSILTTPNGQPPRRKEGAPMPQRPPGGAFDSYESRSLGERCIMSFGRNAGPPMLANGFYNNNYQFLQTAETFVIEVEMNHDLRIVRLNGKHRTDGVRPLMGDSIGRWEGDTLIVETTNIPQAQAWMGSWKDLKITERFTRVGKNRVHYAFTAEDPTFWDKPWGGEYEFSPLQGVIYEYACHEGNYALPGILAGARVEEAEKAKAAAAKPATTGSAN
jgi:hypothetical protein